MKHLTFLSVLVFAALLEAQTAQFPTSIADNADLLVARNNAQSTLAAGINDSVTTFTVAAASSFISDMVVVIGSEQIFCTTFAGTTFSVCTRGFDSTTPAAHSKGDNVSGYLVAWHHNTLAAELKAIEQSLLGTSYIGTFVRLGGTTSSFPALKRNGVGLEVWLADGSALTWISSSAYILGASGNYGWSGRSKLTSAADGNIMLSNAAKNDFGLLRGGGVTASFPAWKRVGAGWEARTADDGGDTTIKGSIINAATGFRVAGAATSGQFLRGNSTNFVDAAIAAGDIAGLSPTWTGDHDFGGGTLEVPNSITLPGTCTVGDGYMDTDASTGQRWYLCESLNTWALQGGGGTNDQHPTSTVAALPAAASNTNNIYGVTDGANKGDCVTGLGTDEVVCLSDGSNWLPLTQVLTAGPSGGVSYACDSSECEFDIDTAVMPRKAAANTWTGNNDFGGATGLEIPNAAAPVVNVAGEIALDTTVASMTSVLRAYGVEELAFIPVPIAEIASLADGDGIFYDAAADEFQIKAPAGGDTGQMAFILDGQGSAISTGVRISTRAPANATITGYELSVEANGAACSVAVDIWADTVVTDLETDVTNADSICDAGTCPALSTAKWSATDTLTSWTTDVVVGDRYVLQVDSAGCTGIVQLILKTTRD